MIYETERLFTREMTPADLPAVAAIVQDPLAMPAYGGPFSDEETRIWLDNEINRYRECGFGLWAVALKESGEMIGQCGLTLQMFGELRVPEIGYLFQRAFWGRGYATEAARGAKEYAFDRLDFREVFSIIRDTNLASMNVAIRNGMLVRGRFTRDYRGLFDMPHYAFSARRESA